MEKSYMKARSVLSLALCLGLWAQAPPRLEKAQVLPVTAALADDAEVAHILDPIRVGMKASFGRVLVQAPRGLLRGYDGDENLLGYWLADLMRARAQAMTGPEVPIPFAFTNSGGLRANLRVGPVTVGDVYQVMPFENELVVVEWTGAQILDIVQHGLHAKGGEPWSGILAHYGGTLEHPVYTITWADGTPIDPKGRFRVATSDYLASNWVETHPTLHLPPPLSTGLTLRQLLLDACEALGQAGKPLLPPAGGRTTFDGETLKAFKNRSHEKWVK
jgi:2',3'-cyclic-nucleotide 2'-phosphodiesterase (5'-nucleotidase family)